ncbi:MAG: anhydro-N-acetylmuramic acid kinase [Terriglobia bacterium]
MKIVQPRWALGLISGTSMDGIDAALVKIGGTATEPTLKLRSFVTLPYPTSIRAAVMRLAGGSPTSSAEISRLNFVLGGLFAEAGLAACRKGRVPARKLMVIGSHGQTVFHQGPRAAAKAPRSPLAAAHTLQIGEAAVIAERTGAPVVADFRVADMAAGGEGAPLVPMVDYLLLRDEKIGSIALNLGGIANLTAIRAGAREGDVFGFDTGPANMVIDGLIQRITRGKRAYDKDGAWARRGKIIEPLIENILSTQFFRRKPPKSAGREQFGGGFVARYFLGRRARPQDLLATATELTARSVAQAITRFVFPRGVFQRLIVSGGGAHNRFLLERLRALLPGLALRKSDDFGLPVDAKEAMAFALLADRTLRGLPGNLPAVTGASRAVPLGKLVGMAAKRGRM